MRPVPGTEGAWAVFWSPDSRSVYFSVKRLLKEANLDTSSTRSVANLPFLTSLGTWRAKGDLLLYLGPQSLYELRVDNGALRSITGMDLRLPNSCRTATASSTYSSTQARADIARGFPAS